jgi:hypothetical protein
LDHTTLSLENQRSRSQNYNRNAKRFLVMSNLTVKNAVINTPVLDFFSGEASKPNQL